MWVLTKAVNDYDQHGDYLETVFAKKPTLEAVRNFLECTDDYAQHVLNGGGRIEMEDDWYYLSELQSGVKYIHSN